MPPVSSMAGSDLHRVGMTRLPTKNKGQMKDHPELPVELTGVLVNDIQPDPEAAEIEKKIELLKESRLILTLSNELMMKLNGEADYRGKSVEDYCVQVLAESLNVQIGKAHITGPSFMSGQKTGQKIKGPSFATNSEYAVQ